MTKNIVEVAKKVGIAKEKLFLYGERIAKVDGSVGKKMANLFLSQQ